jgi:acyl-CoA thioester hydrolase
VSPPFRHRLRVRWAECDPQGVVFNAHFVMYFDTVMTELWRQALGGYTAMLDAGTDMVVAEVTVRYLGPARFDDELEISAALTRLGTTSMTTRLTVERGDDREDVAEGELRHVFVDPETMSKKPIPDDVRRALVPYAEAS